MFSNWQIIVEEEAAYIYKRKYWLGLFAVPWAFSGGTYKFRTPDAHDDVVVAAIQYVNSQDPDAVIQLEFGPEVRYE